MPDNNRENKQNMQQNTGLERDDLIAGRNAVTEVLKSGREIEYIMVAKGAGGSVTAIVSMARQRGVPVKELPREKLDYKFPGVNHQGVAAAVSCAEYTELDEMIRRAKESGHPPLFVILDELEDPHNLGAVIRTAEAAGVDGIIIPKRRAVGLGGIVAKIASGAVEYVPVARVANLVSAIKTLKENGVWIYGADMDGEDLFGTDLSGACAIVIGSEGKGISRLIKENCDFIVSIPMFGKINSLNASVAAGIMMYEAVRCRSGK